MKKFVVLIAVIIAVGAAIIWYSNSPKPSAEAINSFDECVKVGNPVMESYPRQCRSGDRTFTEPVEGSGPAWPDGTCRQIPKFEFYSIDEIYSGRIAEPDFNSKPEAATFRGAIRTAMSRGVNFAGHYVVAEWGCGTSCQDHAIIDAQSGEIIHYGLPSEYGAMARSTSSLLVLNNPQDEISQNYRQQPTEFYELKSGKLEFLCRIPVEQ